MKSMKEVIQDPEQRQQVVDETAQLVDNEVARKRGVGGAFIKSGYAVVKRMRGGRMIHNVVDGLLDEFIDALEPYHAEYRAKPRDVSFADYLTDREDAVCEALLGVTDKRAETTKHGLIKKTYFKLRPRAESNVKEALPGLAELVERHTDAAGA